jgi:UDP-N-acetylmuramoylalanine--D-glutamate ligase
MLREGGISAVACGNVGTTVLESVESAENYQVLVLELSSFQLHWLHEAEFDSIAVLNIAPDHVDWHGDFESYAAAKMSILDRTSTGIFNANDGEVLTRAAHWQGRKVFFSLDTPGPGEIGVVEELLVDRVFVIDPQEAVTRLKDWVSNGSKPAALFDLGGENVRGLARATAGSPGAGNCGGGGETKP